MNRGDLIILLSQTAWIAYPLHSLGHLWFYQVVRRLGPGRTVLTTTR